MLEFNKYYKRVFIFKLPHQPTRNCCLFLAYRGIQDYESWLKRKLNVYLQLLYFGKKQQIVLSKRLNFKLSYLSQLYTSYLLFLSPYEEIRNQFEFTSRFAELQINRIRFKA